MRGGMLGAVGAFGGATWVWGAVLRVDYVQWLLTVWLPWCVHSFSCALNGVAEKKCSNSRAFPGTNLL